MKRNNGIRKTAQDTLTELSESQRELGNFHKVTMDRVFGMLANAKEYKLHPLVLEHLTAIKKLGNS